MGVPTLKFSAKLSIFIIALTWVTSTSRANPSSNLPASIALGVMQYIEWASHPSEPHVHTFCIVENQNRDWSEFQKKYIKIISIDNHQKIKETCDLVLVEREYSQLISAINVSEGPKATIIVGVTQQSLINGAHFVILRDGENYKIFGNPKKLNSSQFVISSKLLRLVKMRQ